MCARTHTLTLLQPQPASWLFLEQQALLPQGLCTDYSRCLECSSPTSFKSVLRHPLTRPRLTALSNITTHLGMNKPPAPSTFSFLLQHLSTSINLYICYALDLSLPLPMRMPAPLWQGILLLLFIAESLVSRIHGRCSMNICWMEGWMDVLSQWGPSPLENGINSQHHNSCNSLSADHGQSHMLCIDFYISFSTFTTLPVDSAFYPQFSGKETVSRGGS